MYLDSAASAKAIDERASARMGELLRMRLGNASSAHEEGRRARRVLREAREELAGALGADPDEIIFTSGVTEALFLAVRGMRAGKKSAAVSRYEHAAMFAAFSGVLPVTEFGLDAQGMPDVDLAAFGLVGVSAVNHETGMIAALSTGRLIVDAAQAGGRAKAIWASEAVAAMALSSHKVGGPSGVGALLVRKGAPFLASVRGGHQEHELRAGTEAVIAIAGFARAFLSVREVDAAVSAAFEAGIAQVAKIVAADRLRAPGTTAARITGVPARALLEALDRRGVEISAGAACASQKDEPSNVMRALGLSRERGLEVFRVSFGKDATVADATRAAQAIVRAARELRGEVHA